MNVLDEGVLTPSVTVTVNAVYDSGDVGVPLMLPLLVLNVMPLGSVPPEIANVYGDEPPVATTGVNGEPLVQPFNSPHATPVMTVVVLSRPATMPSVNVSFVVRPAASVTVISYDCADCAPPTEPEITPVDALSPSGNGKLPDVSE